MSKGIMERAIELAKSGKMKNVNEIQAQLGEEGHLFAHGHLSGQSTRAQLRALIRAARESKDL